MVRVFYHFHLAKFFITEHGYFCNTKRKKRENVFYQATESLRAGRTDEYICSRSLSCKLCAGPTAPSPSLMLLEVPHTDWLLSLKSSRISPPWPRTSRLLLRLTPPLGIINQPVTPEKSFSTLKEPHVETQQVFIVGTKLLRL